MSGIKWAWIDGVNLKACYLHGVCWRPKLGERCSGCEELMKRLEADEKGKPFLARLDEEEKK